MSGRSIRPDARGLTDMGKKRNSNEDQFLIASIKPEITLESSSFASGERREILHARPVQILAVADGVGGQIGGGKASRKAVRTLQRFVKSTFSWCSALDSSREDDLVDVLRSALRRAQESIRKDEAIPEQGATTLTMAVVAWPRAYVIHAGDSRCYLSRGSRIEQVTKDHTMGQRMVEEGVLSRAEASGRFGQMLWNVVGGESVDLHLEAHKLNLKEDDVLLLCSDGLTRHVEDAAIGDILRSSDSAESACQTLVQAANREGGTDNITVVVKRFGRAGGT